MPAAVGVDPRLLLRLSRSPLFLAAVAGNLLGFGLHVSALQVLPLFVAQAVIASSVAVTAVLSVRVFAAPLTPRSWSAVGAVVLGLALLAPTAEEDTTARAGDGAAWVLLGVLVVVAVLARLAGRLSGPPGAVALGLLAGTGFGVVAVAARLLPTLAPASVLRQPGTYVLLLAGLVAFLLYSVAMQRGSVTTTTAAMVVTQTALPAAVGALLLGDRVREGLLPVALVGFALALGGALGLARYEAGAPVRDVTGRGLDR